MPVPTDTPVVLPIPERRMTVQVEVRAPINWTPDDVRDAFIVFRPYGVNLDSVNVSAPAEDGQ